jgi:soluble lytic murein transglycosylase-like protein
MLIYLPILNSFAKKMIKPILLTTLLLSILLMADFSAAGIYRYEDENGVIHFSNCPRDPKFKLYIRESNDDVGVEPGEAAPSFSLIDSKNFDYFISEFAKKYEIEFALIKAMIRAESGFNPNAISRKGAKGLMQLMPATALRMNVSNVFNPKENIEGGVRYFKYLLSLFNNDLRLSLAAYNAGENVVAQLGTIPPYRETVDYVRKVLNFYQSYRK